MANRFTLLYVGVKMTDSQYLSEVDLPKYLRGGSGVLINALRWKGMVPGQRDYLGGALHGSTDGQHTRALHLHIILCV